MRAHRFHGCIVKRAWAASNKFTKDRISRTMANELIGDSSKAVPWPEKVAAVGNGHVQFAHHWWQLETKALFTGLYFRFGGGRKQQALTDINRMRPHTLAYRAETQAHGDRSPALISLAARLAQHCHRRVAPVGRDHAAAGMRAGAAEIDALHRRAIAQPLVPHILRQAVALEDMATGQPHLALDIWRAEHIDLHHPV